MRSATFSKTLLSLGLLVVVVTGCKLLQSLTQSSVIKSTDGKFQITVPAGWIETPSLNQIAGIRAADKLSEMYVIVISENKQDFAADVTLDKYTELTRNTMQKLVAAADLTPALPMTISGKPARQYELQGEVKSIKLAYLVTTVETSGHYHKILAWTLRSRIDENQMTLEKVIESFHEIGPGTVVSVAK